VEEVYGGDLGRIDELIAENYVDHSRWGDREGLRRMLTALRQAYPEIHFYVDDLIAEDDKVAACIHCDCEAPSRGGTRKKRIDATIVFRIEAGKVIEHWGHSDSFF
jgi:predicted ester cyclase